jgi:hypothetical protein
MPKSKLAHEQMPKWLIDIDAETKFDRHLVLKDSIYYPGSYMDGAIMKSYLGFSHSLVYVDAGVSREGVLGNIKRIGGYEIVFAKDIAKDELCPTPKFDIQLSTEDFYPEVESPNQIPKALEKANKNLQWGDDFVPYAIWAVFRRRAGVNESHGPEKFSLVFIGGEGIATYSAIYNSNKLYPKAIVICGADIGFGSNWTFFEKKGGPFERLVLSNKAGIPKYLLAWGRYSPNGSSHWITKENGYDLYWDKYTRRIQDKGRLNVWIADGQCQ